MGNNKKIVITFAVNMFLLNIQAELLLSPTFHAIYPALHLCRSFWIRLILGFVQFSVMFGCNGLMFALLTDCLYISVTLWICVTSVVSFQLFSSLFSLAVSSYSKCSSRTPPLPLSFVMCPERSEKGSLCTCAGEHLNKCIVFCEKVQLFVSYSKKGKHPQMLV